LQHRSPRTNSFDASRGDQAVERFMAKIHIALVLRCVPRVEKFRHVLFLLWRHSGGIRFARDTARPEQRSRYIVLAQTGLAIFELPVACVTWFHA
jgi:hypothetical protein